MKVFRSIKTLEKLNKIERKDKRKNSSQKAAYVYVVSKTHINNQYTEKGV